MEKVSNAISEFQFELGDMYAFSGPFLAFDLCRKRYPSVLLNPGQKIVFVQLFAQLRIKYLIFPQKLEISTNGHFGQQKHLVTYAYLFISLWSVLSFVRD